MEQVVISFILEMAQKYPQLTMLFVVIGVLRTVFKPFFAFLSLTAAATPTDIDDQFLAKVLGSKVYKALLWFIDYIASVKLPGVK